MTETESERQLVGKSASHLHLKAPWHCQHSSNDVRGRFAISRRAFLPIPLAHLALAAPIMLIAGLMLARPALSWAAAEPVLLSTFGDYSKPSGVAVDESTGNVFVADSAAGTIVISGPEGDAPAGVAAPYTIEGFNFCHEPSGVAIDNTSTSGSQGALYVADVCKNAVEKFELNPASEQYELSEELSASPGFGEPLGVWVDGQGNVFVADYGSSSVVEFDASGAEVDRIDTSSLFHPSSVATDAAGDLFVQGYGLGSAVYKWEADGTGHIGATTTPAEIVSSGATGVAVDSSANLLYVAMGSRVEKYEATSVAEEGEFGSADLGASERLAVNEGDGHVFVADAEKGSVAVFGPPPPPAPPMITSEAVSSITDTEANLEATIRPERATTSFHFEYGLGDCADGDCERVPAQDVHIGSSDSSVMVKIPVANLQPATLYHFRVVAINEVGRTDGADQAFSTFPTPLRRLPDGRAYELVSPPDTGAAPPTAGALGEGGFDCFTTALASPDGTRFEFFTEGGSIPALGGNGFHDSYQAVREPGVGWASHLDGPLGPQAEMPQAGSCFSPDLSYSTLGTNETPFDKGDLVLHGERSSYVRGPGNTYELAGRGSIATDQHANIKLITGQASNVIFTSNMQLEPNAPETIGPGSGKGLVLPTNAIYDRSGGVTKVASLLPGDATPPAGTTTYFQGASKDGSSVVFKLEEDELGEGGPTKLFERREGVTKLVVASSTLGGDTFAGVSRDGSKAFYVATDEPDQESSIQVGQLFEFDWSTGDTTPITPSGEAVFVNISEDGSHVYFISPEQLDGAHGSLGANNLYLWDGAPRFIATVDPSDVVTGGEEASLAEWTRSAVSPEPNVNIGLARDTSRTTPDGEVIVFESRANLTEYDSGGHSEIYRYDAGAQRLACLSCNPSMAAAESDAHLQHFQGLDATAALVSIPNVADGGRIVFFETAESLTPTDVNGAVDVYEWTGGRVFLISSGQSSLPSRIYGVTPDGRDVFFSTYAMLVPQDKSEVRSIYDARVAGGFPAIASSLPCQGDACQPKGSPPALQPAVSNYFHGPSSHHRARKKKQCRHRAKRHHAKAAGCGRRHRHSHSHSQHHSGGSK